MDPHALKILQWNIRSIRSNRESLLQIIHQQKIQVAIISETWLHPNEVLNIPNFVSYRHDRPDGYGGSLILVRNNIPSTQFHTQQSHPILNDPASSFVATKIHPASSTITIASIYIPPNSAINDQTFSALFDSPHQIDILAGDFNAKSPLWGNPCYNSRGALLEDAILDSQVYLIINTGENTFIGPYSSSAIDLSICKHNIAWKCLWQTIPDLSGSNHLPIIISFQNQSQLSLKNPSQTSHPTYHLNINKIDWNKFTAITTEQTTNIQNIETSPLDAYHSFLNHLTQAILQSAPPKKSQTPHKPSSPTWWTPECTQAVIQRKLALQNFRISSSTHNYIQLRKANAHAKRTFKLSRKSSWKSYISSIKSSTPLKEVWNKARAIRYRSIHPNVPAPSHDQIITFLSNTIPDYVPNIDEISTPPPPPQSTHWLDQPFTLDELTHALHSKKDTSPGIDNISYSILKHLSTSSLVILCRIFNSLWATSSVPESWLHYKISPIPKKNSSKLRPIALATCIRKLVDSILNKRLVHWIESNNILPPNFFGFRVGSSTINAVSHLVFDVHQSFINREHVIATFLDVESAYPSVHLPTLAKIISEIGLPPHFANYIILMYINQQTTTFSPISPLLRRLYKGLPQGFPLSPTLYNIYSLSLIPKMPGVKFIIFADDIIAYSFHACLSYAALRLQSAINELILNAFSLSLSLSPQKSSTLVFSLRPHNLADATLACGNTLIPIVTKTKCLGITLDSKLTWTDHIKELISNITPSINFLKALSSAQWGSDPLIMTMFYKSFIQSKIDYGSTLYGSASKSQLDKIDRIQNQCLRLIIGALKSTPIPALYAETGILPLHFRRNLLADRFIARIMSHTYTPPSLTLKIRHVTAYWRFAPHKLPLLCKRATNLLKLQKYTIPLPPYPTSSISFPLLFNKHTIHKIPNLIDLSLQAQFASFIFDQFPNHTLIFTDGSKSESGVGAAFWIPSMSYSCRMSLPSFTSIFHAEQVAIFEAIKFIKQSNNPGSFLIVSDSLSALHSFSSNSTLQNKSLALHITLLLAYPSNTSFQFLWVPSHSGITHNDKVDQLAKQAIMSGNPFKTLPLSEIFNLIHKSSHDDWSFKYPSSFSNTHSPYLAIQPLPPTTPWYTHFSDLRRAEIIKLSRLRFGHNRLPMHLFRIGLSPSPFCPLHTDTPKPLTLNHLFFNCPNLTNQQNKLYSELLKLNLPTPYTSTSLITTQYIHTFHLISGFLKSLPPEILI